MKKRNPARKTIREVMYEVGINQKELARECKVTESCISYVLSGKRKASIALAIRMGLALDLTLAEVVTLLYPQK